MAGPPAPPVPPAPQPPVPQQPIQPPIPPNQSIPAQLIQDMPQLNWSHFIPEFEGNWMKMQKHIFSEQMIGWTHTHISRRCQKSNILSYINRKARL